MRNPETTAAFWQHWQPKASLLLNLGALHLAAPPAPTTFRTHPSPVNVITASPTTETSDQLQTRLDSDPGALDSSFTISPFFVLALSMHALLIIEYITMLVEDSIVSSTLANPRADETTPPTKSESLQSYCRRWTGELRGALGQNPGEAATLLVLCAALVYIAGWIGGDLDVKLSSRSSILLVKLELLTSAVRLVQPLKHLVPASILPRATSPPALVFAAPLGTALKLETHDLITYYVDSLSTAITLIQLLVQLPRLPWYFVLVVLSSARSCCITLYRMRRRLQRSLDLLGSVVALYGTDESSATQQAEDWTCVICLELREGLNGRCRLACGHIYHADCLVHWLSAQNFCPICNIAVVGIRPVHRVAIRPTWDADVFPAHARRN